MAYHRGTQDAHPRIVLPARGHLRGANISHRHFQGVPFTREVLLKSLQFSRKCYVAVSSFNRHFRWTSRPLVAKTPCLPKKDHVPSPTTVCSSRLQRRHCSVDTCPFGAECRYVSRETRWPTGVHSVGAGAQPKNPRGQKCPPYAEPTSAMSVFHVKHRVAITNVDPNRHPSRPRRYRLHARPCPDLDMSFTCADQTALFSTLTGKAALPNVCFQPRPRPKGHTRGYHRLTEGASISYQYAFLIHCRCQSAEQSRDSCTRDAPWNGVHFVDASLHTPASGCHCSPTERSGGNVWTARVPKLHSRQTSAPEDIRSPSRRGLAAKSTRRHQFWHSLADTALTGPGVASYRLLKPPLAGRADPAHILGTPGGSVMTSGVAQDHACLQQYRPGNGMRQAGRRTGIM
ncbi:hypothetical protein RCH17_003235 [Arthrobacter sp. MP_M7]|nr:hypothetical protein [Arthrobacter sp. MP_M4]MEC5204413.1 hypothetical protein [Arthrobacter sp. MP_M7]